MAEELVVFPDTWDSIVASRKNNEALYLAPTESNLLSLGRPKMIELAYKDYKVLQLNRERWLAMRIEGELKFSKIINAALNDDAVNGGIEYDMYRTFVDVGINSDIHTMLLPQSLSQGFLTNLNQSSVGWELYRDMKRYDTALLIAMEGCFKKISISDATTFIENDFEPGQPMENDLHTKLLSHRLIRENVDETEFRRRDPQQTTTSSAYYPIQEIENIPIGCGRDVVRGILKELCPERLSDKVKSVIRATVEAWVIEMMRQPANDRAKFVIERTRIGLISNYVINGVTYKSLFPTDGESVARDWFRMTTAKSDDVNPDLLDLVPPMIRGIQSKARRKPLENPPTILMFDGKIRSESVFYTNSTLPLIIAAATCILYLHKVDSELILAGTETVWSPVEKTNALPQPLSSREAGLISLTTHTIHELNMSLSELRKGDNYSAPSWSPPATANLLGPTWRDTATNLIRAWKESHDDSAECWIRGLKAAMLVIDGNLPVLAENAERK